MYVLVSMIRLGINIINKTQLILIFELDTLVVAICLPMSI